LVSDIEGEVEDPKIKPYIITSKEATLALQKLCSYIKINAGMKDLFKLLGYLFIKYNY